MKTALIHDWIYSISGAEKVLESIYELYPSDIYTLIKNQNLSNSTTLPLQEIKTSFIQKLPFSKNHYPYFLPLYPKAISSFDLSKYDLLISSSSCAAKGIKKRTDQLHICYCHTPMRFLWDLYEDYLRVYRLDKGIKNFLVKRLFSNLRKWDVKTSRSVDYFIANSHHTASRIKRAYQRDSVVIYPPVDVDFFIKGNAIKEDYFVTAARFVPYKKIDLIIKTFNQMPDKKLIVLGQGPLDKKLRSLVKSDNIKILGYVGDEALKTIVSKARAFIYMAHEDFGILPVEAQACGTPIIAYGKGGLLETTLEGVTSILFKQQAEKDLLEAVKEFEDLESQFDPSVIKEFSKQFSKARFNEEFGKLIEKCKKEGTGSICT